MRSVGDKTLIPDSYLLSSTFKAWYIDHGSEEAAQIVWSGTLAVSVPG